MHKPITCAIVFMFAAITTITGQPLNNAALKVSGKRVALPEGIEVANAIARLGELSSSAMRERLTHLRPPDNLSSQVLVQKLVEAQGLTVATGKRVDQLKAALQPVLDYHERSRMPIYVLWTEQPKAYITDCAVIFITTRLMTIATDEEIRGVVAHELAHEYVWQETVKARKEKDWELRRECELFCDAVAAITLKEIGDNPASYGRILERMTIIGSIENSATNKETRSHPALDVRKKLNQFLCQRLD